LAIGLVALDVIFGTMCSSCSLFTSHLSAFGKLTLLATNMIYAGVLAVPICLICSVMERKSYDQKFPFVMPAVLVMGLLTLLAFGYLLSWTLYNETRQFLDRFALGLILASPESTLAHGLSFRPWLSVLSPLLAFCGAILVVIWHRRAFTVLRIAKISPRFWLYGLAYPVTILAGAGHFYYLLSDDFYTDPTTGATKATVNWYIRCRDDHLGPLSHLAADLRRLVGVSDDTQVRWLKVAKCSDPRIGQLRRRIVPMSHYVEEVSQEDIQKWNVIILMVESLRPDQLVTYGGVRSVMPTVDDIARDSIVFQRVYANASHSDYADLCPLSSQYPLRDFRRHTYPKVPEYPRVLFYDVLKSLDYRTAIISSQNENWGAMANYLDTGNLDLFLHAETYQGRTYIHGDDPGFAGWAVIGKRAGKIDDADTIAEAIKWISQSSDRCFSVYVNLQTSHIPYAIPDEFPRKFSPQQLDFTIAFNNYPPEKASIVKDVYADSLAYVDFQIAKLVDALKRHDQWDRTVLVITGDTGQAFYEHGFAAHGNMLYDEVMRVPLIVRAPGQEPQVVCNLTQHVDVPPILFSLMGLPPHPAFQGINVLDPMTPKDRPVFLLVQTSLAHQVAVVSECWKLIYDLKEDQYYLYNLEADPGETRDLSGERQDVKMSLACVLGAWCKSQLDYYGDRARLATEYPPVLSHMVDPNADPPWLISAASR
jgi:arylsulfatase A-like enzyme